MLKYCAFWRSAHWFIVVVMSLLLSACGGGGGGGATTVGTSVNSLDLFPEYQNYRWYYNYAGTPESIQSPVSIASQQVYPLLHPTGAEEYYGTSPTSLNYFGIYIPQIAVQNNQVYTGDVRFNGPLTLFSNSWVPGTDKTFSGSGTVNINPTYGQVPLQYQGSLHYYGIETVAVPFGNFQAHHIHFDFTLYATVAGYNFALPFTTDLWLTENLGIVKRIEGGVTFELTNMSGAPRPVEFSVDAGSSSLPAGSMIKVDGSSISADQYTVDISYAANTDNWLGIVTDPVTHIYSIQPLTADLPPGTYTAMVNIHALSGQVTSGSVSYNVDVPTLLTPNLVTLSIDSDTQSSGTATTFPLTQTGETLEWSVATSASWLTAQAVSANAAGGIVQVVIDTSALKNLTNGTYHETVSVTFSGRYVTQTTKQVPVTVNVGFTDITQASPYVIYLGTTPNLMLTGQNLLGLASQHLLIDGNEVSDFKIVDDAEVRLNVDALVAGEHSISVTNALGLSRKGSRLLVKSAPIYSDTVVPLPGRVESLAYDPERDSFYGIFSNSNSSAYTIERIQYRSGSWKTDEITIASPLALSLKPDGQELLVVTDDYTVKHVNPETLSVTQPEPPWPYTVVGYKVGIIQSFNDGQILVGWPFLTLYPGFQPMFTGPGGYYPYGTVNVISSDRNRAMWAEAPISSGPHSLYIYDAKTDTASPVQIHNWQTYFSQANLSISADGSRFMHIGDVYDGSLTYLGSLTATDTGLNVAQPTPDGRTAVFFDYTANSVSMYDISGPSGPFSKIGSDAVLPNGALSSVSHIEVSLNARIAFLFGTYSNGIVEWNNMVVHNLPTIQ